MPSQLARWAPSLHRIVHYDRRWLRGDVLGGVTVAAYLVPQVMAYAEVAGLPPVAGLWAVVGAALVYAVVGASRQLSVGPESTTALMTAAAVGPLAAGDPSRYATLAATLALLVGVLCLVGRLLRFGALADLLSKPVLLGYMAGVAILMVVSQLDNLTGVPMDGDSTGAELASFVQNLGEMHLPTVALSLTVLVLLLVGAHRFPHAPIPLLGMLFAAAVSTVLDLPARGVEAVGSLPAGLPAPSLPVVGMDDLAALMLPALGVAIVGYSDNVLTARAFAARNGYPTDANQELVGLGGANVAAGLIQGFPVSSSGSRTVIGDALGSRSQVFSLVAVAAVVLTLLVLRPVLATFPKAALGAIVVYAALRLIQIGDLRRLGRFRRSELLLALATTVGVLFADVLIGVLVAVGLSIADLLRRVARPHDGILGYVPGVAGMHDVDDYAEAQQVPGLVVYRYDSPLFFANAENFRRRAIAAVESAPSPAEWFVLNAEAIVEVDATALDALVELHEELTRRGIVMALARVKQDLRADLVAAGFLERLEPEHVFMTLPTAVRAYVQDHVARHGEPPTGFDGPPKV
ncbi:MAG TPA: sulfate permease [Nocardioidaceae bacterium]|jgi:high affinity sulfate transporter 1|nr:sulfate permease [Nocardioidaceae bacterium]